MANLQPPVNEVASGGRRRQRSSSIKEVYEYLKTPTGPEEHHLLHLETGSSDEGAATALPETVSGTVDVPTPLPVTPSMAPRTRRQRSASAAAHAQATAAAVAAAADRKGEETSVTLYGSPYLRWLVRPGDSFIVIATFVSLFCGWQIFFHPNPKEISSSFSDNPFAPFILISYPLSPQLGQDTQRYSKGPKDLMFIGFYIIVFSFLRQFLTQYPVKALAKSLGIKRRRKIERFMEQGYAAIYFGCSSAYGLYVMRQQKTWWYQTEHFWLGYPHWDMQGVVKGYYLTQFAYWLQQALVMIARLEKPRDDYFELILHHIITMWLVGASYITNMTQIGICVFVSMDIPDFMLAISKCINYVGLERTGNCSFVVFMGLWGYFRHYQNIRMLYSVWTEYELIQPSHRVWIPEQGLWMPGWMQYQVFAPILALQIVIAFWSYLILRVVARMVTGKAASDVREEGESEVEGSKSDNEPGRRKHAVKKRQ